MTIKVRGRKIARLACDIMDKHSQCETEIERSCETARVYYVHNPDVSPLGEQILLEWLPADSLVSVERSSYKPFDLTGELI